MTLRRPRRRRLPPRRHPRARPGVLRRAPVRRSPGDPGVSTTATASATSPNPSSIPTLCSDTSAATPGLLGPASAYTFVPALLIPPFASPPPPRPQDPSPLPRPDPRSPCRARTIVGRSGCSPSGPRTSRPVPAGLRPVGMPRPPSRRFSTKGPPSVFSHRSTPSTPSFVRGPPLRSGAPRPEAPPPRVTRRAPTGQDGGSSSTGGRYEKGEGDGSHEQGKSTPDPAQET